MISTAFPDLTWKLLFATLHCATHATSLHGPGFRDVFATFANQSVERCHVTKILHEGVLGNCAISALLCDVAFEGQPTHANCTGKDFRQWRNYP